MTEVTADGPPPGAEREWAERVLAAQDVELHAACDRLVDLGYTTADLRAVPLMTSNWTLLLVLQVRGRDVLEIETSILPTIRAATNVLAWPPPVDSFAPQGSRAASGA